MRVLILGLQPCYLLFGLGLTALPFWTTFLIYRGRDVMLTLLCCSKDSVRQLMMTWCGLGALSKSYLLTLPIIIKWGYSKPKSKLDQGQHSFPLTPLYIIYLPVGYMTFMIMILCSYLIRDFLLHLYIWHWTIILTTGQIWKRKMRDTVLKPQSTAEPWGSHSVHLGSLYRRESCELEPGKCCRA